MVHNHVLPDENRVPMLAAAMREVARLEVRDVLLTRATFRVSELL